MKPRAIIVIVEGVDENGDARSEELLLTLRRDALRMILMRGLRWCADALARLAMDK